MIFRTAALLAGASLFIAAPAISQSDDLDYTIINRSSAVIDEFFVRAFDREHWTQNLLFNAYILPGEEVTFIFPDGRLHCEYEIFFRFSTGDELLDAVDICDLEDFTIYD